MLPAPEPVFEETQWFWHRWRWLLIALTLLVVILPTSVVLKSPSWLAFILLAALLLPVLAGLWLLRLTVRVDAAGIHYQYVPMLNRWRHWPWSDFRRVFPRTYSPFGDYGGWGIKGLPGDLVYNVWGPAGLQLVFQSGNKLLLGTQQPQELQKVLAALLAADASKPITLATS